MDVERLRERVDALSDEYIVHDVRSEERWEEQWRRNDRADLATKEWETRMRTVELWKANLAGRFGVYAAIGAAAGAVIVDVVVKLVIK